MNLINKISRLAGNYYLQKKSASVRRDKRLVNLYDAGSVGILFELNDSSVYHGVHRYMQNLQDKKIKVKALGFSNSKIVASQFLPVLSFDIITRKQLNALKIPRAACVQDFVETEFDICINIASEEVFPLKYISAVSKARLKAGSYFKEIPGQSHHDPSRIYDILVLTDAEHDQIKFLDDIHQYLTILNPTHHA